MKTKCVFIGRRIIKRITDSIKILFDGIASETIAILVFVIIISHYNKIMAYFTIISFLYEILLSLNKEYKIKKVINSFIIVLSLISLYITFNYNVQGKRFLSIILEKNTWTVWLGCITVNSFVFSKLCNDKSIEEKVSHAINYILVLIFGVYFSIIIEMVYIDSQQDDKSANVNFICFAFMIVYSILEAILPTKEEIILYTSWKYELDYKNGIIKFISYKGKKHNVNIYDTYIIRGKYFHSFVCIGAFSCSKYIEKIEFQKGVKFERQYFSVLFKDSSGLKEVYGLTNDIKYNNAFLKRNCPNIKRIEYVYDGL